MLESRGGSLVKLYGFAGGQVDKYRYLAMETNADFVPGLASLTKYNSASCVVPGSSQHITEVGQAKPHANLCGIVALPHDEACARARISDAVKAAAELHEPEFS